MPISASAKKALRVSERKTAINRYRKRLIRVAIKNASAKSLPEAVSLIDKAVKWQIFHPNKAARLKSQLMTQFAATPKEKTTPEAKPAAKKTTKTTVKKAPAKKTAKTTKK